MLSAREQTEKTWAKRIESYGEIPVVYLPYVEALLDAGEPFPLVILTPTVSYEGFQRRLVEKLVFQVNSSLYVIENRPSGIAFTEHCQEHINCIEVGTMLLRAWIKISSFMGDQLITTLFEFNAVSMGLFQPMIEAMRQVSLLTGEGPNPERDKFNYLIKEDFKFMNYARKSILPGAIVCTFILHPEVTKPIFFDWALKFYRSLVPKHMCILTNKELILIREELEPRRLKRSPKYGGVWQYIPMSQISSLQISAQSNDLLTLSVALPGDQLVDIPFNASYRGDLQHLLDAFLQSAGK